MKEPLEDIMLNEIHQAQRDMHYMSHLCVRAKGLRRKVKWWLSKGKEMGSKEIFKGHKVSVG